MDPLFPPLAPASTDWLALSEARSLLLDGYPALVLGLDLEGRIAWINPAGATNLGYGREELTGRPIIGTLLPLEEIETRAAQLGEELGERVAADATLLSQRLQRGMPADEHTWVLRHRDGSPLKTRLTIGALRDAAGRATGLIAVEPATPSLEDGVLPLTTHDALTGLPTAKVLADRAEMALQRAARQKSVLGLLVVELVGFTGLCEEHGHSVGDDVLRATAGRLHFELRKTDTAVRLAHGRFAAMLVDLHDPVEAERVAEKIRRAVSGPVNVGVARLALPARVGVAWFPTHGDQLLPLLEAAEGALAGASSTEGGVATAQAPSPQAAPPTA
jgi:diguanylate cyclase (GGDEF)-like protein